MSVVQTQAGVGLEFLEYDEESQRYEAEYDRRSTTPSMAIVAALSAVTQADPVDLDPLYEFVDTDALDALLAPGPDSTGVVETQLSAFEHSITVRNTGHVLIEASGE